MPKAHLRFYAELNDFLPPERRFRQWSCGFGVTDTIKQVIESAGVPHTEVDLVLRNGAPVGFDAALQDGDRLSIYPVFESIDISSLNRLRPEPLRHLRFVLDTHLGRLAAYLRMCGFDTVYGKDWDDARLALASHQQGRVLLTRDTGLLKRKMVTRGYFLRRTEARGQLMEVLERFDLRASIHPFTRCLRCNSLLVEVRKEDVLHRLPERVGRSREEFRQCMDCRRLYWKGTHYERMRALLDSL